MGRMETTTAVHSSGNNYCIFAKSMLKRFVFVTLILGALFVLPESARASARRGISITPSKSELVLAPGSSWHTDIELAIDFPEDVDVSLEIVDFRGQENNEGGVPYFYQAEENQKKGVLSRWMALEDVSLQMQAYEITRVPLTINIPKNADPGGYYGAVLFHTVPSGLSEEDSGAGTGTSIAALFLVTVPGDIEESGELVEFFMDRDIYETPPLGAVVRFANQGSVHLKPQGRVEIYNTFGKLLGSMEINLDGGNVLPGDVRRYTETWGMTRSLFTDSFFELPLGDPLMMGRYKAKLWLWYGQDQRSIEAVDHFWVLPWKLIVIVWVGLTIFFYITRDIHFRYMKWLWKRARTLRWQKVRGKLKMRS